MGKRDKLMIAKTMAENSRINISHQTEQQVIRATSQMALETCLSADQTADLRSKRAEMLLTLMQTAH